MRPTTACANPSLIYIPYILICNPFFNPNVLVFLKILLEIIFIMRIFTLYCKRLLFPFVKLRVTSKKSSGPVFADLSWGCKEGQDGTLRECNLPRRVLQKLLLKRLVHQVAGGNLYSLFLLGIKSSISWVIANSMKFLHEASAVPSLDSPQMLVLQP